MELCSFLAALAQGGDFVLATALTGAEAGSRCLLRNGQMAFCAPAQGLLARNAAALAACTTSGEVSVEGERVFVERFGPSARLVVCGGGHVGASVARFAKLLELPVCALEDRAEYADCLREAGADEVICAPFTEGLARVHGTAETYFVVVTRAHAYDVECLEAILQKPAAYVGMMGSRSRAALVRRQLTEAGADTARVESLDAPIGLAIGAKTAPEIALSIAAKIVDHKSKRQLTEGFSGPIIAAMREAERTPAVLLTIVSRHGSTPREIGAKMLVFADGKTVGSVGGGILEHRACQMAAEMLKAPHSAPRLASFVSSGENEDAAVAACGGSMEIFMQRLTTEGEANI